MNRFALFIRKNNVLRQGYGCLSLKQENWKTAVYRGTEPDRSF